MEENIWLINVEPENLKINWTYKKTLPCLVYFFSYMKYEIMVQYLLKPVGLFSAANEPVLAKSLDHVEGRNRSH